MTKLMKIYVVVLFCVISTGLAKPPKKVKHNYYKPAVSCTPSVLSHSLITPGYNSFCGIATVDCIPINGQINICSFCAKLLVYKAVNGVWQLKVAAIVDYDPSCGQTVTPDEVVDLAKYGSGSYYATWAGYQGCLDGYNLWYDQSGVLTLP